MAAIITAHVANKQKSLGYEVFSRDNHSIQTRKSQSPRRGSSEDNQLMAQGSILHLQCQSGFEESADHRANGFHEI
jgi:hypothetical protein